MLFNSVIRKVTGLASLSGGGKDGEGEPPLDVLRHRLALLAHVLRADVLELGQVVVVLLTLLPLHALGS